MDTYKNYLNNSNYSFNFKVRFRLLITKQKYVIEIEFLEKPHVENQHFDVKINNIANIHFFALSYVYIFYTLIYASIRDQIIYKHIYVF